MIRSIFNSLIMTVAILLAGCTADTTVKGTGNELDFSQVQQVSLAGISTSRADNASNPVVAPMEIGKTFRLYAFPKGVTDMTRLIATRTYTIKDAPGNPVLDAGQDGLFLPLGAVDVFLVGPVMHNDNEGKRDENNNPLAPLLVEVAAPHTVSPRYGADLVSSKTSLNVKVGANQFQADPLCHRMAQTEVVVRRPEQSGYTNLKVTVVSIMNQTLTGEFVFNDTGGEITPAGEGTETLLPVVRNTSTSNYEEFRATAYTIPRQKAQLRIGVFFTCTLAGGANVERRMGSGIMEEELRPGEMNRFITKPILSDDLIFRLRLLPWDDVSAEELDVLPFKNQLFSYSGLDAPISINGKLYVPDRSGNNRHGELVGDIRYDAEEKYYYAASKGAYIKVPPLGYVPVYTFEMTAASKHGSQTIPILFTGEGADRTLGVYLPWGTNSIYFDSGDASTNRVSTAYNNNDLALMEHLAVYAFTRETSNILTIYRNGVSITTNEGTANNGLMTDNRLIYWRNDALSSNKMYAARMTTNVDPMIIQNNYRNDIANFVGITVDKDYTKRDYIEEGLILDLRGEFGYTKVDGRDAWPDQSRAKNHAVVRSATSPTYNKSDKYYNFNGSSDYMQLLYTLGKMQNFTVEVVTQAMPTNNTLLNFASNQQGGDNYREFSFHLGYDSYLWCYSPFKSFGREALSVNKILNSMAYPFSTQENAPNQWSITRYNEGGKSHLYAWLNGILETSGSVDETSLFEMRYCFIGSNGPTQPQYFGKPIYAIRVYNRVLTELERQHNYQTDKIKYNVVPN